MCCGFTRGIGTVVATRAAIATNGAVIHNRRGRKTRGRMTHIARRRGWNMSNRGANGQNAIVASFALRGQHFENTTGMTGFAINQIMITRQWKTGNEMVECRRIRNGRGESETGNKNKK